MIISRTPFRVSLFGGGTDFPEFYRAHGGAILSAAIDQYCYISLHRLAPYFPHRFRASYSRTESVQSPADFQHPLVRECLLHLSFDDSVEISHVADLPGRSGLASSSAFTVGLLHALAAFRGDSPPPPGSPKTPSKSSATASATPAAARTSTPSPSAASTALISPPPAPSPSAPSTPPPTPSPPSRTPSSSSS